MGTKIVPTSIKVFYIALAALLEIPSHALATPVNGARLEIFEATDSDPAIKANKAARTLQRAIRQYTYKKNKPKIYADMYQQGLRYRDGRIVGYEKDSFLANARAGACFFPLARQGDVKAQHNFAMIKYKLEDYDRALHWFAKASAQGFGPSTRNLALLQHSILRLPPELLAHVAGFLDDNTMLTFRLLNHKLASIAEIAIKARASIKPPLTCLTAPAKPHPFPHTLSYYLRKSFMPLGTEEITEEHYQKYLKCAEFSEQWGFVGKDIFIILGKPTSPTSLEEQKPQLQTLLQGLSEQFAHNTDVREFNLWFNTLALRTPSEKFVDPITFSYSVLSVLSLAKQIPVTEAKDIASFYMTWTADCLARRNLEKIALGCYAFSANTSDAKAQCNLGAMYEKMGDLSKAQEFYEQSASQGYPMAQNNLGHLLMRAGKTAQARQLFLKAAEAGQPLAQYNLGSLLFLEGDVAGAKKYLKYAANQGQADAHFNLALIFEGEGNMNQAKTHYKVAADRGFADAQCNYAVFLCKEGKMEEARRYYLMAIAQGDQLALTNYQQITGVSTELP